MSHRGTLLWCEAEQGGEPEPKPATGVGDLAGGRLLFCNLDESVIDGASEAESGGFFDVDDVPPWDTWVALHTDQRRTDVLVCWVPRELQELAERGIEVNCVDCVGWLAESRSPLANTYRSNGFL
jgi:hypothetical protein